MGTQFFFLLFFSLFIISCSKTEEPYVVDLSRGTANQAIIKITKALPGKADRRLFEEQGYHEAKDRLLQMDLMRRLARGTLSEVLGKSALDMDKMNWGVTALPQSAIKAAARIAREEPEINDLLQGFADGVNRFIGELPGANPGLVGDYQFITKSRGYYPTRWEPADSIAIMNSVTFYLSSGLQEKLIYGAMLNKLMGLGRQKDFANFLDLRPLENVSIIKSAMQTSAPLALFNKLTGAGGPVAAYNRFECNNSGFPLKPCATLGQPGSNNWVLNGVFTGTGQSIVANDPHLILRMPMAFYESALDSTPAGGSYKVAGFQIVGIPGILIGHNVYIAWAMTNDPADVEDVYIEQLDRKGQSVLFNGKYVKIITEVKTLQVRDESGNLYPTTITLRTVPHHGPVISDHITSLAENMFPGKILSYRWVGHEGTTETVAMLKVDRAKNFAEFKKALVHVEAGAQNIVYADVDGNIGYYSHGKFPIRPWEKYSVEKGILPYSPMDGSGDYEWKGFRTAVPELYNPPANRIVTANQDPFGYNESENLSNFNDYFGFTFSNGIRAKRIMTLLDNAKQKGPIGVEEVRQIQYDHVDGSAVKFLSLLSDAQLKEGLTDSGKQLMGKLTAWDGSMTREADQPIMYYAWLRAMLLRHFSIKTKFPEYLVKNGEETAEEFATRSASAEYHRELKDGEDMLKRAGLTPYGITTLYHQLGEKLRHRDPAGTDLLLSSLNSAAKDLFDAGLFGQRWGSVHPLRYENSFKNILPDSFLANLERDGSYDTVDMSGFPIDLVYDSLPQNLPNNIGPNFRLIMTLKKSEGIQGYTAVPGGNYDPKNERAQILTELNRYRDGGLRPLVSN
jgi:acyl-homoserine lactone acylase PvdQ